MSLCYFQMLKLWRRDVPLSGRLGEDSPLAAAPGPPPMATLMGPNISWLSEAPLLSSDQPIFLMTLAAQAVSGFFVWTALILTCHQVTASQQHNKRHGYTMNPQVFNSTSAGCYSGIEEILLGTDFNWVGSAGVSVWF